jgi:tRNA(Ile)-lysidine synthase
MHHNIERLTSAQRFIQGAIDNIYKEAVTEQSGVYTLHVDCIADPTSRDFVIYEILSSHFGFKGDVVDGLCKALEQNNSGKKFYSRSNVAYVDRGDIVITSISENDACEINVREGKQRAYCGNSVLYFEECDVDSLMTYNVPDNVALLDADKVTYPITLRRWMEGDSFTPFGMTGSKKVSDFLIDAKVSMAEKGRQFVLLSEGKIAWLIGRRISDDFRITNKTERVIRITKEII